MKEIAYMCYKEGTDLRTKIKKLRKVFLNSFQMSAQAAAFIILSIIPIHHTSRSVVFIPTTPKESRNYVLKNNSYLDKLHENSTDIVHDSWIEKYIQRRDTKAFNNLCLADYVSLYDKDNKKHRRI